MALVTLQRSPTPSAASSASTTNSSAGEVSGKKPGARSLCEETPIMRLTGATQAVFNILQKGLTALPSLLCVNLIYCSIVASRELFVATVAADL